MRPRDVRQLLQDIQVCIRDIEGMTAAMDYHQYANAKVIRLAVERQFITIGEAIRRTRAVSSEIRTRIDDALRITGFRNFLVNTT